MDYFCRGIKIEKMKRILLFVLFTISLKVSADHIVGGYMGYEYMGNDQYKITLWLYRDCNSTGAPLYSSEILYIYNSNNTLYQSVTAFLEPTSRDTLPITLTDSCLTTNANVCVEQASYSAIVYLAPLSGGATYYASFQRCCRSAAINNIVAPNSVGSTFYVDIPTSSASLPSNASPVFIENNPVALCAGYPFTFNSGATDTIDGDSLVYSFVDPYGGGSQSNVVPTNPMKPFPSITWMPGYSVSAQISCDASNPLAINSQNGIITGTPNQQGYFVVSVQVREYRNGVLISAVTRDFQFKIVSCTQAYASSSINNVCKGGTYGTANVTIGGGNAPYSYTWTSSTDTIITNNVSGGTYSIDSLTQGTYTITVTDVKGCFSQTPLTIAEDPYKTNFKSFTACLNDTAPLVSTPNDNISNHVWYNNNDTVNISWGAMNDTLLLPISTVAAYGTYIDSIVENNTGCRYRYVFTLQQAVVNGSTSNTDQTCAGSNDATATVSGVSNTSNIAHSYTYSWSSNPVQSTATATNLTAGTYTVSINYGGCIKTDTVIVGTKPFQTSSQTTSACANDTLKLIGIPSGSSHQWYSPSGTWLGNNDTITVINPSFGLQYIDTVTTTVNAAGCKSRILQNITQLNIVATTSQIPTSCYGGSNGNAYSLITPFVAPHGNYQYAWSNGATTMNATGLSAGTYTLIVSSGGCFDTTTITISQPTPIMATYGIKNVRCDSLRIGAITASASGGTPVYTYSWMVASSAGNTISALEQGDYVIEIHDSKGCTLIDTATVAEDFVEPDTSLVSVRFCPEDQTAILLADSGFLSYQWFDGNGNIINGATSQQYTVPLPQQGQHYSVTLTPIVYGCKQSIDIDLGYYLQTELPDYVPLSNIFTPNGDGLNDVFDLSFNYVKEFNLKVYDRWGKLVYESIDVTQQWNGKDKNGKDCDNGTYYWIVSYLPSCVSTANPETISGKGFVQLFR